MNDDKKKMIPLSVACARICIKTFMATTLIVQLPKTLSTALLILKFLNYCVYNNINIKIENPLHTINLKPIYNSLYKNLEIEYISVKRLCFLILLISESKSINCHKQSLDFTKKTRAKRFYFGLKRNQVIKGVCLTLLVLLLMIPMLKEHSPILNSKLKANALKGYFEPVERPAFSLKNWWSGDFQNSREEILKRDLDRRPFAFRLNNQLHHAILKEIRTVFLLQ